MKGATVGLSASRDLRGDREYGSLTVLKPLPFGSDSLGQPLWTLGASHLDADLSGQMRVQRGQHAVLAQSRLWPL